MSFCRRSKELQECRPFPPDRPSRCRGPDSRLISSGNARYGGSGRSSTYVDVIGCGSVDPGVNTDASARKHGVTDDHMLRAYRNHWVAFATNDLTATMFVGSVLDGRPVGDRDRPRRRRSSGHSRHECTSEVPQRSVLMTTSRLARKAVVLEEWAGRSQATRSARLGTGGESIVVGDRRSAPCLASPNRQRSASTRVVPVPPEPSTFCAGLAPASG